MVLARTSLTLRPRPLSLKPIDQLLGHGKVGDPAWTQWLILPDRLPVARRSGQADVAGNGRGEGGVAEMRSDVALDLLRQGVLGIVHGEQDAEQIEAGTALLAQIL